MNIYIMTHRKYTPPEVEGYTSLQVGAALGEDLGYQRDDEGENISQKNRNYSELTGLYWMWKNAPKAEITGLVHYRRYFVNRDEKPVNEAEVRRIMGSHQAILTPELMLESTVREQYVENHMAKDLVLAEEAIRKISPEYLPTFEAFMNGKRMHFANMIITSSDILDRYCEWLFAILFEVESHMDMTGYDDYNKRVYGFLSERLLTVWILHNRIDFIESDVSLFGAKSDAMEACWDLKRMINSDDMDGAIKCYEKLKVSHPDYFQLSNGTVHFINYCFVIQIYELEKSLHVVRRIYEGRDADAMVDLIYQIRDFLLEFLQDTGDDKAIKDLIQYIKDESVSAVALAFIVSQYLPDKVQRMLLYSNMAEQFMAEGDNENTMVYANLAIQQQ